MRRREIVKAWIAAPVLYGLRRFAPPPERAKFDQETPLPFDEAVQAMAASHRPGLVLVAPSDACAHDALVELIHSWFRPAEGQVEVKDSIQHPVAFEPKEAPEPFLSHVGLFLSAKAGLRHWKLPQKTDVVRVVLLTHQGRVAEMTSFPVTSRPSADSKVRIAGLDLAALRRFAYGIGNRHLEAAAEASLEALAAEKRTSMRKALRALEATGTLEPSDRKALLGSGPSGLPVIAALYGRSEGKLRQACNALLIESAGAGEPRLPFGIQKASEHQPKPAPDPCVACGMGVALPQSRRFLGHLTS